MTSVLFGHCPLPPWSFFVSLYRIVIALKLDECDNQTAAAVVAVAVAVVVVVVVTVVALAFAVTLVHAAAASKQQKHLKQRSPAGK